MTALFGCIEDGFTDGTDVAGMLVKAGKRTVQLGEMQRAFGTPSVELGTILLGQEQFVRADSDITVFEMTGLALQALTVARLIYERASKQSLGSRIAWPW